MSIRLSFETGTLAGMHIITAAPTISLGREPSNDIVLSMPMVSRRHATISKSVRGFYSIEIIGSGPSHINSDALTPIAGRAAIRQLSSGDHLDLAGVQFVVAECEVRLMCVTGPAAGKDFLLTGNAVVGRALECDFVIPDASVSRKHLEISATPSGFVAKALNNAAFNGQAAPSRMLAHGDEIVIGDSVLRVNVKAATDDREDYQGTQVLGAGSPTIIISAELTAVGELVFIAGAAKGEKILLGDDQIIIGNSDSATRTISDPLASPMHCAISKAGDQFVATDLRSERGTFINGTRITTGTELKPGDLIAIGSHVLESRMLGGVRMERRKSMAFSVVPEEPTGPQPKFVIDGRVMQTPRAIIGRIPTCDIIVDHPEVSREHCLLEWDGGAAGFFVKDTSSHGTYLDDKRVVRAPLSASCVLRVGNMLFRITARGEVCTIERTDAALAEAAVAVAREQASQLASPGPRSARGATVLPPSLAASLANAPAGTSLAKSAPKLVVPGQGLKTMFRLDVSDLGQLEQEIQAKKKDLQRGAPAWRPSSDLARQGALRGAIVLSVLAALAVCGGAIAMSGGSALVNHPLSAAHSSAAFTAKAGSGTSCAACHSAGTRVDNSRCVECHKKFEPRSKHSAFVCGKCHAEHDGAPANSALGANDHCAECHTGQHAKELAIAGPQRIAAGPLPMTYPVAVMGSNMTDPRMIALHVAHTKVKVGGKDVGIGCTACHGGGASAKAAAAGGLPSFDAFPAGLACYRCHTGGENPKTLRCEGCHGVEHAASPQRTTPPVIVGSTRQDTIDPTRSLEWAGGLGLIGGAPALLFGLVLRVRRRGSSTKMVEQLKSHPAEVVKRLVHSINDSKCVGCGLCVQACPASVLELVEHKSRVVNFDSCIQCKRCETACAFDALRMHDADKPPPMIAYPSIDAFYETPVAGMFLVGQVSGTPQVKNATNLGRAVAQRIVQRGYTPGSGKALGCDHDVIIVGSGPGGLSAALTCIELGLSYVVLEKEREFSWTIRNYYHKGKEVMAEPHDVELEATLPHWDSSREELLGAWQELVVGNHVDIRYQHNVVDIAKQGEKFVVGVGDKGKATSQFTAGRVIIAIGTLGNPRTLGCPGEELAKVKNSLVDPDEWTGKSILVVGGSDSAVEVVLALCQPQRNNKVYFSTRGAKLEGIKPKNRKLIEDALAAGQFEMRYATAVADVTDAAVGLTYKEDNRREELPNDVIFAMIGGNSPQKWLQQIGVPYIEKPHSWSPTRTDQLAQKTAEGLVQIRRIPRKPVPEYKPHH